MVMELNDKQAAFCKEYIIDFNIKQAAIRAGYSKKSAHVTGSRLLNNAKVQEEIADQVKKRNKRTGVDADMVIEELKRIAFMDIKDMVEWGTRIYKKYSHTNNDNEAVYDEEPVDFVRLKDMDKVDGSLISSVKMTKHGMQIEFHDKMRALEALAKHTGVYDDRPTAVINVSPYVDALKESAKNIWSGEDSDG